MWRLSRLCRSFLDQTTFEAHRLLYHSTLGLSVIKKKKKKKKIKPPRLRLSGA